MTEDYVAIPFRTVCTAAGHAYRNRKEACLAHERGIKAMFKGLTVTSIIIRDEYAREISLTVLAEAVGTLDCSYPQFFDTTLYLVRFETDVELTAARFLI